MTVFFSVRKAEKTFEFGPLVFSRKSFCFVKVLQCNAFFYYCLWSLSYSRGTKYIICGLKSLIIVLVKPFMYDSNIEITMFTIVIFFIFIWSAIEIHWMYPFSDVEGAYKKLLSVVSIVEKLRRRWMVMYPLFIQSFTERELADLAEKNEMFDIVEVDPYWRSYLLTTSFQFGASLHWQ